MRQCVRPMCVSATRVADWDGSPESPNHSDSFGPDRRRCWLPPMSAGAALIVRSATPCCVDGYSRAGASSERVSVRTLLERSACALGPDRFCVRGRSVIECGSAGVVLRVGVWRWRSLSGLHGDIVADPLQQPLLVLASEMSTLVGAAVDGPSAGLAGKVCHRDRDGGLRRKG